MSKRRISALIFILKTLKKSSLIRKSLLFVNFFVLFLFDVGDTNTIDLSASLCAG